MYHLIIEFFLLKCKSHKIILKLHFRVVSRQSKNFRFYFTLFYLFYIISFPLTNQSLQKSHCNHTLRVRYCGIFGTHGSGKKKKLHIGKISISHNNLGCEMFWVQY